MMKTRKHTCMSCHYVLPRLITGRTGAVKGAAYYCNIYGHDLDRLSDKRRDDCTYYYPEAKAKKMYDEI